MSAQPTRPPSPADRQAEALSDIKRLTYQMRQAMTRASTRGRKLDEVIEAALLDLLHRDVIRVGARPSVERPIDGQITIEDEPGG